MNPAAPQTQDLAKRLIDYEMSGDKSFEPKAPAVFYVCETLRPHLSIFMGDTGFHALLSRALVLAYAHVSWLQAVQVKADGSLGVSDRVAEQVAPEEMHAGSVALVSQLLSLLMAFIGANLTLRMVREVWPKLSLNDLEFSKGDKNEKAK
jgi:hypothetical protein